MCRTRPSSTSDEKPEPYPDKANVTSNKQLQDGEVTPITYDTEQQYPGFKVVLPTVISACLAVFLTALV